MVTRDTLNDLMQFDHVIHVAEDGTVTEPRDVFAPEWVDIGTDEVSEPWSLMTGYTGQYGYRGPIMHPSEFIGGRMADDILSMPGYYVAIIATEDDGEAGGWAVAYRED